MAPDISLTRLKLHKWYLSGEARYQTERPVKSMHPITPRLDQKPTSERRLNAKHLFVQGRHLNL
jgi:hypothetical protein